MTIATDQRTLDYYSDDPRRVLAACGDVSEDVLRAFAEWCCGQWAIEEWRDHIPTRINVQQWANNWCHPNWARHDTEYSRAAILRCLIPPPDLGKRVECKDCRLHCNDCEQNRCMCLCPTCLGEERDGCESCKGTGSITLPFAVDPRWLSSTVIDLAATVRGGERFIDSEISMREAALIVASRPNDVWIKPKVGTSDTCVLTKKIIIPPRFDLMPILADALMDAGMDCEEIETHLRSDGPHVAGQCWVIEALTKGAK